MTTRAEIDSLKGLASNIVDGGDTAYTEAMFYEDFPQFKKAGESSGFVPPSMMRVFLTMVNSTVSEARWCESWRLAAGLFVAHYVTMYLRQTGGNTDGSTTAKKAADTGHCSASCRAHHLATPLYLTTLLPSRKLRNSGGSLI